MGSALNVWSDIVLAVHACNVVSQPAVHGTVVHMQCRDNDSSESQPSQKMLGTARNTQEEE